MLPLCEAVSRRLCRWLTGWDMTLCAFAWWRRDKHRRLYRVLKWGLWWVEQDHPRQSYERRWLTPDIPKGE
ncbi:hypothetical protein T8A63_07465 [Sulfitobacter sp. OXR-159]|uniref:hypothetical protein n=1 Tax=Sulfitobacter sp. OXR-159 TaxID=3100174 RepID=UPI002AC97C25|nr:hypothetical protein [Sulfitobacter sp. OXR-159]WPZ30794.1 hypothetical protein T8A63_06955 [Sulfitobacter sp. OXR-159]WPZ30895.1 hypothetical protein T8A63_07465 [Sulfitobacter sp. OXR-159]